MNIYTISDNAASACSRAARRFLPHARGAGGTLPPPEVTPNRTQAFQRCYRQRADKLNLMNTAMPESTQAAGLFGVNCKHCPMTFIPGFSTLKGEPQDEEENEQTYAESQEQRALERKLREEKRELAVMKAQGAPEEEIRAQRERVRKASQDIDDFCDETGRARRRNREGTPINAPMVGDFDTELVREFFYSVSYSAAMNLHFRILSGTNAHHIIEGMFKCFSKALDMATQKEERITDVLSTKGSL